LIEIVTFIKARRYETLSLHQLMQGLKVDDCAWLAAGARGSKISVNEALKRRDLVHELVYWFFDGFLVPLLKVSLCTWELPL
jgi:telomerase reverse transcriptase